MNKQERSDYIAKGWTGEGWLPLIMALDERLSAIDPDYDIHQIKEKFGGLRYYFGTESRLTQRQFDEMHKLELWYENLSFEICEVCGSKENVTTFGGGWVRTRCEECK
jgi:hypothetical protein